MALFSKLGRRASAVADSAAVLVLSMPNPAIKQAARKSSAEGAGAAPWRVLFVGADPLWFGQIKSDVECLHPDWLCLLMPEVGAATENPEWRSADALVVEGGAAGTREWMETVKKERPNSNCLIRCDLSDKPVVDAWKGLGYSMVASTSDASMLALSLLRNARLLEWMADPAIKRILPLIRKLPATPRLYVQVIEELRSPNSSLDTVAHLIRQDPVMSAKMLQLVNSAFFASAREVTDMLDAAMILGSERIKSLVLLAGVFSQYNEAEGISPSIHALLAHSIRVGIYARAIALGETKNAELAEAAFTAGVLHDIGKIVLAGNMPERYLEVRALRASKEISSQAAELEVFGATHAQVGACLLAAWGLPLAILEALAWHHEPERSSDKTFSLLAAVHAANAFAHETEGMPAQLNQEFLERIGLAARCPAWRQLFGLGQVASA
jgi:putative nucleotidyltransferase with HDIG domain